MENKSKFNTVLLVIIILLIVSLGYIFLRDSKKTEDNELVNYLPQENQNNLKTNNQVSKQVDYKEFKNDEIGFSFSYPAKYGDINNVYPATFYIGKPPEDASFFGSKVVSGNPSKSSFYFIGVSKGVVIPGSETDRVVDYDSLSGQVIKTEFGEYKYIFIPAITDTERIDTSPARYLAIFKLNSKSGISYINFHIVGDSMSLEEFKAMLQTVRIY